MSIKSYAEFCKIYDQQNSHKKPRKEKTEGVSGWIILTLLIILVGINIVSGERTIVKFAETVASDIFAIKALVGVAGFFSVEFTLFAFMAMPIKSWWRNLAISLAFVAALVANLWAVTETVGASSQVIGIILGTFPPIANMAAGEVLRQSLEQKREEDQKAYEEWISEFDEYNKKRKQAYSRYLKKKGVTDDDEKLDLMGGDAQQVQQEYTDNDPDRFRPEDGKWTPETLAEAHQTLFNGTKLTYNFAREHYKPVSQDTIREAKAILEA